MQQEPQISDAEWQVMNVIWDRQSCTASDVVDALAKDHNWSPRTIKTMLSRLLRKGALSHRTDGKRYVYFAARGREQMVKVQSQSFLDRVFRGDALQAMVHLAQEAELSPQQLEQLRTMLKQKSE